MTTNNKIQCYEIWEWNGKLRGHLIDHKPAYMVARDYPVSYDLRGKDAHFIIVSNDMSLTRKDAIDFACCVHMGLFTRHSVDLKPCQPHN